VVRTYVARHLTLPINISKIVSFQCGSFPLAHPFETKFHKE